MASLRDTKNPVSLADKLTDVCERHFGTEALSPDQLKEVLEAVATIQGRVIFAVYDSHTDLLARFEHFLRGYIVAHTRPPQSQPEQPKPLDDRLGGGGNPKLN